MKYTVNTPIPVMENSRWTTSLKKDQTFEIIKETGSFFKVKSPSFEDNTVVISILKRHLSKASKTIV